MTKIINKTDENGIKWAQKRGPVPVRVGERESDGKPIFTTHIKNIGKSFKVSDPNYVAVWPGEAGVIDDDDQKLIGIANGVAFTAFGGILLSIFCVAVGL